MPLLGFQKQFAQAVEDGTKRQTIRAFRKDKRDPQPGQTLYLYTGLRTKACRKLGESVCTSVELIGIGALGINILEPAPGRPGTTMVQRDPKAMALADGFISWEAMRAWFRATHGLPWRGVLIRWGPIVKPPWSIAGPSILIARSFLRERGIFTYC